MKQFLCCVCVVCTIIARHSLTRRHDTSVRKCLINFPVIQNLLSLAQCRHCCITNMTVTSAVKNYCCSTQYNCCMQHTHGMLIDTMSDRIGKVVASHAKGCKVDSRLRLHRFIICTIGSGGAANEGGGYDQSIRSTVSDAIVRSWSWSTATRSSQSGYSSR